MSTSLPLGMPEFFYFSFRYERVPESRAASVQPVISLTPTSVVRLYSLRDPWHIRR